MSRKWWPAFAVLVSACKFGAPGAGNNSEIGTSGAEDTADDGRTTGPGDASGIPGDDGETTTQGADDDPTTAPGEDTSDGAGSSDDGETGGPPPGCGNGVPEAGEDCDDGDDDDANGCTNACKESGSVIWISQIAGDGGYDELLRDVVYHPTEDAYFAAGHARSGASFDSLRATISTDGDVEVAASLAPSPDDAFDHGIAVAPDGTLGIAGTSGDDMVFTQVDSSWSQLDTLVFTSTGFGASVGWGIAFEGDGAAAGAGYIQRNPSDNALAVGISSAWDGTWSSEYPGPGDDYLRAIAWSPGSELYYATRNDGSGTEALIQLTTTGANPTTYWFDDATDFALRGVATGGDVVFACGMELGGNPDPRWHAWAFDLDLGELWHEAWDGIDGIGSYCIDVAVDDAGNGVFVGATYESGQAGATFARPVVRKLKGSDGTPYWTTLVEISGAPQGTLTGVDTGPGDRIVAVGGVGPQDGATDPVAVALEP